LAVLRQFVKRRLIKNQLVKCQRHSKAVNSSNDNSPKDQLVKCPTHQKNCQEKSHSWPWSRWCSSIIWTKALAFCPLVMRALRNS